MNEPTWLTAQAFPTVDANYDSRQGYHSPGMSLRDYFAGQAVAGICAGQWVTVEQRAREAYQIADAMMKARAS